jgi:putative membrane-bound dehydrogenase-like protein
MKSPGLSRYRSLVLAVLLSQSFLPARAAQSEPEVDSKDLPRVRPTEPAQALQTFQVKRGFRIELVAAEPLVRSPIALSFDENGRLFVVEMVDYSERRAERLGRIRMLEDTDGDGRFDKSTIFADNLPWPTGVICYDGGVFVAATPDLLYLKDTDGDGVADLRKVVFTGFGNKVERLNVQQLFNSLTWALDNRIEGANGGNGGVITSPDHPDAATLDLRGRDFSFDPRTGGIRAESGGGQYGLSFDDRGRKFVCSNSSHIRPVMYEERYAARNPYFAMPAPSVDIAVDGPAAEVYRISPDEPWRVIRTKWRVSGVVPGLIEGGGRPSGYFTGATGIMIYRGDAWPEEFHGNAFVADCGSNLVHRKKVYPDGAGYKAERPEDEQRVEFLASRDNWFRAVQLANAPDGALYVIDIYREVIEHPWSLPQNLKKHLDLNSGNDRGRIFRVVPEGFKQRPLPRLGQGSMSELVGALAHPNSWHRETAARLIYERQDKAAIPELQRLLANSLSAFGRMQALYALQGLGALGDQQLTAALLDNSPVVRQHGVRLAEAHWEDRPVPSDIVESFSRLAGDSDAQVRYQLAFSLGSLRTPGTAGLLAQLIQRDVADSWMRVAVLNSSAEKGGEIFALLARHRDFMVSAGSESFLRQLMTMIGVRHEEGEVGRVLGALRQLDPTSLVCSLASALGEGIQRTGGSLLRAVKPEDLQPLFNAAQQLLREKDAGEGPRLAAVRLLGQGPVNEVHRPLRSVLEPGQSPALQRAAVGALAGLAGPDVGGDLLDAWDGLTPALRSDVVDALLRRSERVAELLSALESAKLHPTDLSPSQVAFLRTRTDAPQRERAVKLLGQVPAGTRQEIVNAYAGALTLAGNGEHGHALYLERCSSCHRLAGEGHALGPDLETVRANGKNTLLTNLLDPNREVMPKYVNYLAETKDGETFTGLIATETDSSVVLRQPNGNEVTLLRSNLQHFRSLGQSAMPEGLEQGLTTQDVADLMEYILTAKGKP